MQMNIVSFAVCNRVSTIVPSPCRIITGFAHLACALCAVCCISSLSDGHFRFSPKIGCNASLLSARDHSTMSCVKYDTKN